MSNPLVTVVCLCYNHSRFVVEALDSVLNQTYSNIQLIVVDDASDDESAKVIKAFIANHHGIEFIALRSNVGNCKAFNRALDLARGEFIIDLAADDLLLPERVAIGVNTLKLYGDEYGVHFSDAEIISETGEHLGLHSESFPADQIPQGDIYRHLISRYFICPPTMMFTRAVQNHLGGYDETLAYEDFDFWMRSSRAFKYCFSDKVLVKKRILPHSKSRRQVQWNSPQMRSTFIVCQKIFAMNKSREEMRALKRRVYYELRLAVRTGNIRLALDYLNLLKKIKA
jgi:glycosyltransferase involved in cell wall biosynthesis